ncbi:uncharacterized protein LOC113315705 [Papaver somniferum]|uniref:uncharacterized protein LOC113315705 n=1 Tax=Papaver somniferum TaxID=3469 RepID=UPI000E70506E|nr:uncharacterized protein LOC113315705 [Papaver somniferum]
MKVSQLLVNNDWIIPHQFLEFFSVNLPALYEKDKLIWCGDMSGNFSFSSAIETIIIKYPKVYWYKKIWTPCVHPTKASNIWKITRNIGVTDENMNKRGFQHVSRCYICHEDRDSMDHIMWNCKFGQILWNWLGGIFSFLNPSSFDDILSLSKFKSPVIQELWLIASFCTMIEIWFTRNKMFFDEDIYNVVHSKRRVLHFAHECRHRLKGTMWNSNYDSHILQFFNIGTRPVKSFKAIECFFLLPENNILLFCCDGATKDNPGLVGYGFIARNSNGEFVVAEAGGLGVATNFIAEIVAVLRAMEWAVTNLKWDIIIQTDSRCIIDVFMKNKLPWVFWSRWNRIKTSLHRIHFRHVYREINFSADSFAKRGAGLEIGQIRRYNNKPYLLHSMEMPGKAYYRFCFK